MTDKHTPEPWKAFDHLIYGVDENSVAHTNISFGIELDEQKRFTRHIGSDTECANASRIVECVNALAGIDNPIEWVNKTKEQNEMLKKVLIETDNALTCISWDGVKPIRLELEEKIEQLQSENEALKAEIAKLEEWGKNIVKDNAFLTQEIEQLKSKHNEQH